MTEKLTDEDKQRIEQETEKYHGKGAWYEYNAFKKGAEYATIYEREQQDELKAEYHALCERTREPLAREEDLHKYRNALQMCYDREKKYEAERSEVRNKVIEEAIGHLNSPLLNFSDGLIYKGTVIELLNALKK